MSKTAIKKSEEHLPTKFDFGDDAGMGRHNEDGEERTIPRIVLIQANSPQVGSGTALPGQLYNVVTEEVIDPPMAIIPAAQDRWFVEKDKDRAFVAQYRATDPKIIKMRQDQGQRAGKLWANPGEEKTSNWIQDTRYLYYVICHEDGTFSRAFTPFKSSSGLPAWSAWKENISRFEESAWQKGELAKGAKIPYPALATVLSVKDSEKGADKFKAFAFNPGLTFESYGSILITDRADPRYAAAHAMADALDAGKIDRVDESKTKDDTDYC